MKLIAALIGLLFLTTAVRAQDEPEYRLELGAGAGLMSYEGDFGGSILKGARPMGELVAKYKPNPRMAWGMNVALGTLKGSSTNSDTYYPGIAEQPVSFKTTVVDVAVRYEYNFWPFGTGREYRGAQRLTPFIAIGLGLTFAKADKSVAAGQMPIGLGVKYKLADRWNLTGEWTMHFTGSDRLDSVVDPYGIKSTGLFKNTDCYSVLCVTVAYDLWAKCRTCHNDRD
jgi:hypothetical protein